jgi:hypothetical protein
MIGAMLKQKSRVYQRYPDIVGEGGPGSEFEFELKSPDSFVKVPPLQTENLRALSTCKPIPFPLFVSLIVIMSIISIVGFIVLPILSVILTEVPYRVAFWFPAQIATIGWTIIIGCNWSSFYYVYLVCYWVPLFTFYMLGAIQMGGGIDWPWYWICVPLYPMTVSVPASYFIMKHLERLRLP